jgi:penicillin-binding protein 1B
MNVQRVLEGSMESGMKGLRGNIQGAAVVLHPVSGEIRAMTGGRDYRTSQFNRAVSIRRNIGSLIKPVVYSCALKNGYTLASILDDGPLSVRLDDRTDWSPVNFDGKSHGSVLLVDALAQSYNLATVRLGLAVGLDRVIPEVRAVLPRTALPKNPSLLLGAVNCSPLDVAGMYAVFASGGLKAEPRCLEALVDANGAALFRAGPGNPRRVLDPGPVFLLNTALQEAVRRGTARSARSLGVPDGVCGKTGTTNDYKDSWFAGYTRDMVVVAWIGDDAFRATGLSGAAGALPVASRVMARLASPGAWEAPEGITFCAVDPVNGKRATRWTAEAVTLPFLSGTVPEQVSEEGMPGLWKVLRNLFPFKG